LKIHIAVPLLCLAFLFCCCADHNSEQANHYEIEIKLDPAAQHIHVKLILGLTPAAPTPDNLIFFLHKQFTIHDVSGQGVESFSFDKDTPSPVNWMPEGRALAIGLDKKSIGNKRMKLIFEYEGIISEWPGWSANVITEEWVELGLYLPWFPYNQEYGAFTFEIEAECVPNYSLGSFGSVKKAGDKWHFKRITPTSDIVLVASKNLKTIQQESDGKRINVHYSLIHDTTAKKLAGDLFGIVELYEAWFGGYKEAEITLVESLRERGGGYARIGLISLAGLSDDKYAAQHEAYIRYLAHEAGHMWWTQAPSDNWEDWMNEGFSEYSALMVIKELFGEEAFNRRIEAKKNILAEKPPIWDFDRNDRTTPEKSEAVEAILYSKGPVLLSLLEQRIGRDIFLALCKEMVRSSISSTEDFLTLLHENCGTELRDWFEDLLRSY